MLEKSTPPSIFLSPSDPRTIPKTFVHSQCRCGRQDSPPIPLLAFLNVFFLPTTFLSLHPISGYFQFSILLTHYHYGHGKWFLSISRKGQEDPPQSRKHKSCVSLLNRRTVFRDTMCLFSHSAHRGRAERMGVKMVLQIEQKQLTAEGERVEVV